MLLAPPVLRVVLRGARYAHCLEAVFAPFVPRCLLKRLAGLATCPAIRAAIAGPGRVITSLALRILVEGRTVGHAVSFILATLALA